jgi:hypothetical protein
MCPHTTTYLASSYYYKCVLITTWCVLILLQMCPHHYFNSSVLILIFMCPHTTVHASSYYLFVLILLYICRHTTTCDSYICLDRPRTLTSYADVCWRLLTSADVCCLLYLPGPPQDAHADLVWWRMLTYADVCWRMLTYADVCWSMLTYTVFYICLDRPRTLTLTSYAHQCRKLTLTSNQVTTLLARMLTYADVCWRMLTYAGSSRWPQIKWPL